MTYPKLLFSLLVITFSISSCAKQEAPESSPTVITLEPSDVKLNAFTMSGEVTNEGFNATKERGFVWSQTNTNPSVSDNKISVGYGKGQYSFTLEKLSPNTTYYYKSFATNDKGTSYGELKIIKTADYSLATLTTDLPKNITYTSAELGGNVIDEGGIAVTERGICLALNKTPTISDIKITNGKGLGSFANIVIRLTDGSNYSVRSFAINGKGTSYGNEQKFSTTAFKAPTVSTDIISNIAATYVTLQGNVSDNGGIDLIEKGFCLSKNPNPTISDIKVKSSNNETGAFVIVVTALDPQTKFYVKAYSQNSKGLAYGNELSFTTTPATIPTVGTNDFQEITQNSVRAGVEINNNGGAEITEFGVCLSTNRNPTIYDRKVILGTGNSLGKMDNIGGLMANTKYYLRGYAINRVGVAYGPERNFITTSSIAKDLKNNLLGWWPFNGNNGIILGGVQQSTNRFNSLNSSYEFDGINCGSIKGISLPANINNTNSYSVSMWFLSTDVNKLDQTLFNSSPHQYIGTNFQYFEKNQIVSFYGNGIWQVLGSIKWSINNSNNWHHLVVNKRPSSIQYYFDGLLAYDYPLNSTNNTGQFNSIVIGAISINGGSQCYETFKGKLDDVGIWNRELSSEEVLFLYQNNFQP
jgi:hypothetical protein